MRAVPSSWRKMTKKWVRITSQWDQISTFRVVFFSCYTTHCFAVEEIFSRWLRIVRKIIRSAFISGVLQLQLSTRQRVSVRGLLPHRLRIERHCICINTNLHEVPEGSHPHYKTSHQTQVSASSFLNGQDITHPPESLRQFTSVSAYTHASLNPKVISVYYSINIIPRFSQVSR